MQAATTDLVSAKGHSPPSSAIDALLEQLGMQGLATERGMTWDAKTRSIADADGRYQLTAPECNRNRVRLRFSGPRGRRISFDMSAESGRQIWGLWHPGSEPVFRKWKSRRAKLLMVTSAPLQEQPRLSVVHSAFLPRVARQKLDSHIRALDVQLTLQHCPVAAPIVHELLEPSTAKRRHQRHSKGEALARYARPATITTTLVTAAAVVPRIPRF